MKIEGLKRCEYRFCGPDERSTWSKSDYIQLKQMFLSLASLEIRDLLRQGRL